MPSRRQVVIIGSVAVAVVGAIVIWFGAAAIILAIYGRHVPAAAPWLALAKFASLAWAAAVGWIFTWRRLDERERKVRTFSWFIGSTAAILLTHLEALVLLCAGCRSRRPRWRPSRTTRLRSGRVARRDAANAFPARCGRSSGSAVAERRSNTIQSLKTNK